MSAILPMRPEVAVQFTSTDDQLTEAQLQAHAEAAKLAAEAAIASARTASRPARARARRAAKQAVAQAQQAGSALALEQAAEAIVPAAQRRRICRTVVGKDGSRSTLVLRLARVEVEVGADRRVRSVARANVLLSMQRRGAAITDDHVEAGNRFRVDWDTGMIGRTPVPGVSRVAPCSRSGHGALAIEQAEAKTRVGSAMRAMWPGDEMTKALVVDCITLPAWCASERARGTWCDDTQELGQLRSALTRLARCYGIGVVN